MILSDGKINKNIPNGKIKCLKFMKKVKICSVYVKMSVSISVNVSAFPGLAHFSYMSWV